VDSNSVDTCFREFWEESGGLLSPDELALLKTKVHGKEAMTTWVHMGKYVLYTLVLPEITEDFEVSTPFAELVTKLRILPKLHANILPENRAGYSEMEALHWVDIGGFGAAAGRAEVANFINAEGQVLEASVSTFFKTVCRVRVLDERLQLLRQTGELVSEIASATRQSPEELTRAMGRMAMQSKE